MQWWCAALGIPWTWSWRAYPGVWLLIALIAMGYWRHSPTFERHAARSNMALIGAGLLLAAYQMAGFFGA